MNILLVNTFHYIRGGDCTYTFSLAELLRQHGHTVHFFAMKHPHNIPCSDQEHFVEYIDFVEVNRKKNLANAIKVLSRVIYSRQAREKISKLIDETKPDIAHLQNIHRHITPSILYEFKKRGIPVVWTLHDYKFICPNTHLMAHGKICELCKGKKYYYCTMKKCKKDSLSASLVASLESIIHEIMDITGMVSQFVSPSAFLVNKFLEFGWDDRKIMQLPLFLTHDKFMSSDIWNGEYALYLGRLEEYKGVSTLLQASSIIKGLNVKIVGDGSDRRILEKLTSDYKMQTVSIEGYLSGDKLINTLQQASFLVVPSLWYENYPYVVMEAMAAGKPVVASRIGGLPELVEDGITGLLFEPGNSMELAEKMQMLAHNPAVTKAMGKRAKEKALVEFNAEKHYNKLMYIYNQYSGATTI